MSVHCSFPQQFPGMTAERAVAWAKSTLETSKALQAWWDKQWSLHVDFLISRCSRFHHELASKKLLQTYCILIIFWTPYQRHHRTYGIPIFSQSQSTPHIPQHALLGSWIHWSEIVSDAQRYMSGIVQGVHVKPGKTNPNMTKEPLPSQGLARFTWCWNFLMWSLPWPIYI